MAKLSLLPFQDVYISEWYNDLNFTTAHGLFVNQYQQSQDDYHSLLQFELGEITPCKNIKEAILELTIYRNEVSEEVIITAHHLLQDWHHSSVTWDTEPPLNTFPDGSIIIKKNTSGKIFINLTELVRGWHDGFIPNHGLLLKGNTKTNALVAFRNTNCVDKSTWPCLHVIYTDENNIDKEELNIPEYPPYVPLEASTPVSLNSRKQATFLIKNASDSCCVQAIIQLGYSNDPYETFFNTGSWVDLNAQGYPGEAVALTTTDIAEYARVLVRGDGGETVYVWSRTR